MTNFDAANRNLAIAPIKPTCFYDKTDDVSDALLCEQMPERLNGSGILV